MDRRVARRGSEKEVYTPECSGQGRRFGALRRGTVFAIRPPVSVVRSDSLMTFKILIVDEEPANGTESAVGGSNSPESDNDPPCGGIWGSSGAPESALAHNLSRFLSS